MSKDYRAHDVLVRVPDGAHLPVLFDLTGIAPEGGVVELVNVTSAFSTSVSEVVAPEWWTVAGTNKEALDANKAYFARFQPSASMAVSTVRIQVATADAGDNAVAVDAGIYSSTLARLAHSGATTVDMSTVGRKTLSLTSSISLQAGTVYYVALSSAGTSVAQLATSSPASIIARTLFGTTAPDVLSDVATTSHPLPATATFAGSVDVSPLLFLS